MIRTSLRSFLVLFVSILMSFSASAGNLDQKIQALYDAIKNPNIGSVRTTQLYNQLVDEADDIVVDQIESEANEFFAKYPQLDRREFSGNDRLQYYMLDARSFDRFNRETYYQIQSPIIGSDGKPLMQEVDELQPDGSVRRVERAVKTYHLDNMTGGEKLKLFILTNLRREKQVLSISLAQEQIQVSYDSFNVAHQRCFEYIQEILASMDLSVDQIVRYLDL